MNNNQLPRYEQLIKISGHFNVSADYLLGLFEDSERRNDIADVGRYDKIFKEIKNFSEEQLTLLEKYILLLKKVK